MSSAVKPLPEGGLVLNRFRPLRPLGSGGSGSVWLARDEKSGLEVALKIVPKEGKAAPRAEREAQAAARLRHPHCLRAYGFESDSRHVYIAYEYIPGRTMRQALRAGELDDPATVEAAAQVLDGLAFAHAQGIVHRDVKPANVLVADGPEISVRLLDFGLAQLADAETLTAAGDVPGTLAYIPPERLGGGQAGPAADVWAVGVLLWEALAGRHPFWEASPVETVNRIQEGAASLAEARPDLPEELVAAVDRALAVDPAARPSAAGLARELRMAGQERAPRARHSPSVRFRPHRLARRAGPPALAALVSLWAAAAIPFYPDRWPGLLAVIAALLTLWRARVGLAFALAVPVLPLGNVSLGLAVVYGALAAAWLAAAWGDPRRGLVFAAGVMLAPIAALGLLPLALRRIPSAARRFLYAFASVLMAGVVAGVRGSTLPFAGERAPALGVAGSEHPLAVAQALWRALMEVQPLGLEAIVIGLAAAALPFCLRWGDPGIAAFGAVLLAGTLLVRPGAGAVALVLTACVTIVALGVEARRGKDEASARLTFGTIWAHTRALFDDRLKPGGGLGWPRRIGPAGGR